MLSLVGLATRANKVASGEFMTERSVKDGTGQLVIVATDASNNTKKKFGNMCDYYQVPIYYYSNKITLGKAIGKEYRASLGVTDEGLAKEIIKHLEMLLDNVEDVGGCR